MGYELSFAGVPFNLEDAGGQVRALLETHLPIQQIFQEMPPPPFAGKNVYGLARPSPVPYPNVRLNQFYYPTGMSRWACFRGLADTEIMLAMSQQALPVSGATPQTFICRADSLNAGEDGSYAVETSMYLLPPRPLGVLGGTNGLYLITLVDERFYAQWSGLSSFRPDGILTWDNLFADLADALGISLSNGGEGISSVYGYVEPDSQFWSNYENAALLLDAAAWNVGRVVVRRLDGTYALQSIASAATSAVSSRGSKAVVVRVAGGDLLGNLDGSIKTPAGQAVIPQYVVTTFPMYITGDGTPHYYNSRYTTAIRPTAWTEDSYGDVFSVTNTPSTAGSPYSTLAGFSGTKILASTAKALYYTEQDEDPYNLDDLEALALQLTQDYYAQQWTLSLDETYPGTLAWTPEGIHDITWTYGPTFATTRVFRQVWNYGVKEMQHSFGPVEGVGGKTIPLTVRSIPDNSPQYTELAVALIPGASTVKIPASFGEISFALPYVIQVANVEYMEVTAQNAVEGFPTELTVDRYDVPEDVETYPAGSSVMITPFAPVDIVQDVSPGATTLQVSDTVRGTLPPTPFNVIINGETMIVTDTGEGEEEEEGD